MAEAETRRNIGGRAASLGLFLGPLALLATLVLEPPAGLGASAWVTLGVAVLMAIWWATEALPLAATALLPIVLLPLLGIDTLDRATASYANPVIFLFLGGFTLGLAMERSGLHRRVALLTLIAIGSSPRRQIAGFMLATAFTSMWVSNTATTIMMLPIALSVVELITRDAETNERSRFAAALLLAVAYSASVGGIATLIGTPPNALLAAYLRDNHAMVIGFGEWMLVGLPVSLVMLLFIWWWLTRGGFSVSTSNGSDMLRCELAVLGTFSARERRVGALFLTTAAAWIAQPLLAGLLPGINDTGIAIAAALLLFLLPAGDRSRERLLDWRTAERLPWGVLLLFGGGLSLAAAIKSSGLAEWLAMGLGVLGTLPPLLLVGLVVTLIIFLTELTSNTATTAAFLPLLAAVAAAADVPVELLAVPAAIAASCAFMMPVATPPNAIVFGSGHLRIGQMMRAGLALNLFGMVAVTLLCFLLVERLR